MRRFGSVTAALVLCISANLFAQATPPQRTRPVVGLALSGGSALGFAHIGVLRYLEEHRIPVDRIAGTSMGGLLGGLYATGHSAADLEKIVQDGDWDQLLRSTSPYEDRSVSEKQEWDRITGPYSIPLRSSLSLPSGINSGQSLVQLLSGETAAYWDVSSFDDLPIPFRCVATDFLSGEAFILRDGRLPRALRATMAIPGIFTPVDWNGRLLGDGGLVNNLPTDVAKSMGADVVIGVTLRIAPANVLELRTLTDIVRQTINIAVTQSEERNRALADIEIMVDLGNRNSLSFQETKVIIDAGYAAAAMNQAALQKLSVSPEEWAAYRQQKDSRRRSLPASGTVFRVSADDAGIAKSAARELSRKVGDGVSAKNLEPLLTRLTSTASLPNAYFGWRSQPAPAGYDIEIEKRRSTEFMLRPSFFYQYSDNEPGRPTLRIAGTAIPGSAYKSRFIGALFVGPSPGISVEYYHPFDGSNFFVAPGITFERTRFYQYVGDDERQDHSRVRSAASIYGGIGTWRQLQFRVGARGGYDRYSDPMIAFGVPATSTGFVNPEIVGILNTQDSGMLPTRGSRVNGSAGYSFRKHSYPYLEMNFDHFHLLTQDISLVAMGKTNTTMGRSVTFYDQFSTGGFRELDAFRYQEFRGETVLLGGLGFLHRGMNPKNVAFRPIWGAWYEAGTIDSVSTGWDSQRSATAGVFTPTPLGLLGLTVGTNFDGATRWRISIGSFWNRP